MERLVVIGASLAGLRAAQAVRAGGHEGSLVVVGDEVAVEISGLGRLENTVVDWDVDLTGPGEQPATSAQTLHVALAIPEDEAERMAAGERTTA